MNFIVKVEKHIKNFLEDLKFEVISGTVIKNLKPRGPRFEILYGLREVQKQLVDNCPSFTPIMSTVKTPSYNLAKFLVLLPELTRSNKFIVKSSFEFAKEVTYQNTELSMASMHVCCDSINVSYDSLFSNDVKVNHINKIDFTKRLKAAPQSNLYNFERNIFKQIDGVAMESPLRPILVNAFFIFP